MITIEQKKELKSKLEQELIALEKELDSFTKEIQTTPGGHESYVENSEEISQEDQAQVSEEYGRRKALEAVLEKRLEEIQTAIAGINSKKYGLCSRCSTPIPIERLLINPAAATCIQCAK
ncbi:MAG: Transcriptional regulator, TraR/DksA family [Parcubacteria group bacterium GW2011_GWB1_46_8]|nr:MAG: Transcriptional regulator, TraR/DksA family [Parcubacteria group bacterium GW2011_GWF1_45_5]KKU43732.1 MAG: Transcriptional regulator, TraR/DksA family [Parcubacteria group bacterium GW2011_GWA2_46_7]KKU46418.1 MAG: Transcriptional regulator, TraR/DksA family [Parcubacteria group bacterium GW2011_GWB1_46_8]KKU47523.1 MAG: Transcriptional regulator, TraR/DksA family [Parcubacteria group bacterium GW2011_GWF2_46_8]